MGSRLSMPRGPAGTTESSRPSAPRLNSRHLVAPAAAFTMACLLFVYARTSIRAAKTNAQRHRDADSGGEGLNLLAESRRRHGVGERVEQGGTVRQLVGGAREQFLGEGKGGSQGEKKREGEEAEERIRAAMGRRRE